MRRLFTHVAGLPAESAFARARNGVWAGWTQQVELLAGTVDILRVLNANLLAVNGHKPEQLDRVPRPGDAAVVDDALDIAQFSLFLKGGGFG